jgi:hypothetical protein
MTDLPEDDDAHASEALQEARAQKSVSKNTKWVAGAVVATGIGSAALAAAMLYANRGKKKNDQ